MHPISARLRLPQFDIFKPFQILAYSRVNHTKPYSNKTVFHVNLSSA
ncbi:MAG: hypothetical protein ACI89J_003766, partial [Hyphomicrobiaceae bacterium]